MIIHVLGMNRDKKNIFMFNGFIIPNVSEQKSFATPLLGFI